MGKGSPLLTAGRESMIFWRDGIMERVGTIVGKTVGNAVGKSTGNVVGTWPGDAVWNGWEHDRERGLETLETTNGGKQESDGTECYLTIALSLVVPSTYVRTVWYYATGISYQACTHCYLYTWYAYYYISYISYT